MAVILDAHFDVLMDVLLFRRRGESRVFETRHLPALKNAAVNAVICSIFIEESFLPEMALRHALNQIAALREDVAESPGVLEVSAEL